MSGVQGSQGKYLNLNRGAISIQSSIHPSSSTSQSSLPHHHSSTSPTATMPPIPPLFVLPITPAGCITCTQPSARVYLLTFDSPPDNRMTPTFCTTLLLALDILDHRFPKGVVITTSGIQKFYSNGLDYDSAIKTKGFFEDYLYPLWRRLLT